MIDARPNPFALGKNPPCLVVIDMQRDFIEADGFGESLGNDIAQLQPCIPVIAQLLEVFRRLGWPIVHTREAHLPDLSDCPPAKRLRGAPNLRIGDKGPMGRVLVDGEPGSAIIESLQPIPGEIDMRKPGKGAFSQTQLQEILKNIGCEQLFLRASRPKFVFKQRCAKLMTEVTIVY